MNCLACGTCCHSELPTYVRVLGDDYTRLGDAAESLTNFIGNRAFMRMQEGHCAALEVRGEEHVCSIYERRPAVCRELDAGSPACLAEISLKGDRPAHTLKIFQTQREAPNQRVDHPDIQLTRGPNRGTLFT